MIGGATRWGDERQRARERVIEYKSSAFSVANKTEMYIYDEKQSNPKKIGNIKDNDLWHKRMDHVCKAVIEECTRYA